MDYDSTYFIDEIFSLESAGMLSDLAISPGLLFHFMDFDEFHHAKALAYIKSVFVECYEHGHIKVAVSNSSEELHGYALLFVHPEPKYPNYLHKIYVKEQFRGNGLGSQILSLITKNSEVCLLSPNRKISFYERFGYEFVQYFDVPESENFQLSKGLYTDLCVMKNYPGELGAPIFLLNDKDIGNIIGLKKI
ncbi:GNAT family N-acetyltransferase [Methylophaga sp.]|uniref:GNAT family N-acetyltransferase n=1 Tax=Methylophaga sp. TaxID=2024840 RepID=UPI003F71D80C